MGALTGNTVQSTYLDLVQLGKSGAGLPSHAGKEAALYDGAGYQILGRTAQRHWLDPHPDAAAFSETWEFSTKGDMNQTALETAGWTFTGCTAAASNGILWLTASGVNLVKAELTVSFAGDFDLLMSGMTPQGYDATPPVSQRFWGFGVADTANDKAHYVLATNSGGDRWNTYRIVNDTYSTLTGAGTQVHCYYRPVLRVWRVSGVVYVSSGAETEGSILVADTTTPQNEGYDDAHTQADANTMTRIFLTPHNNTVASGSIFGCRFLRRFQ